MSELAFEQSNFFLVFAFDFFLEGLFFLTVFFAKGFPWWTDIWHSPWWVGGSGGGAGRRPAITF